MRDDRSAQIESVFREVMSVDEADRPAFLLDLCGDDSQLRRDVETLIERDQVQTTLPEPLAARPSSLAALTPDTVIDQYRIIRLIARGGFGEVYLAQQMQPVKRQVALKILKPGMDSREVVRRFEAERQALAVMDHPGIAHVYDSGATETGRPYFVMEYVGGVPIDRFCDTERLEVEDRLQLFIDVCHAVHHAHQKGVIHRDLKPSNILVQFVDGKPAAKVIDFGIAKAIGGGMGSQTIVTQLGGFIGTPQYMSPEQAEAGGLDVDIRTDVYSLGVVLYELLIGIAPLDTATLAKASIIELTRAIRTVEPARPSTRLRSLTTKHDSAQGTPNDQTERAEPLARVTEYRPGDIAKSRRTTVPSLIRLLHGDLDWITMKALEKERSRRYESASEFAADIHRHFRHEPVAAGPPTAAYRLRKFVRRNKTLVTAGTIVALVLLLGIIGTTTQWVQAKRQAAMAAAINEYLTGIIVAPLPAWDLSTPDSGMPAGPDLTLTDALVNSLENLEQSFAEYPSAEAQVRLAIGKSFIALSRFGQAEFQLRRALDLHLSLFGEADPRTWDVMIQLGTALEFLGKFDEAHQHMRRAVALSEQSRGSDHPETVQFKLALATAFMDKYDHAAESASLSRSALEQIRRTHGEGDWKTIHAKSLLAFALNLDFHTTEALALAEEALKALDARNDRVTGLGGLAILIIGNCHNDLQNPALALEYYNQALEVGLSVYGSDSFFIGTTQQLIAMAHLRLGNWETARDIATIAFETQLDNLGADHPYTQTSHLRVVVSRIALDEEDAAAVRDLERFLGSPEQPLLYESFLAVDALILHLLDEGRISSAQRIGSALEPLIEIGLAAREVGLGPEGATAFAVQGLLASHQEHYDRAAQHLGRAREIWSEFLPQLPFPPRCLLALGTAELKLGHVNEGRALIQEALLVAREQGREDIADAANAQLKAMEAGHE